MTTDVVKGRAGSPYAVKDYYNVNPDLAVSPANRLVEFEALIARTHKAGLKLIMISYRTTLHENGKKQSRRVKDFGVNDDVTVAYKRDNNYYIPNSILKCQKRLNP
jgi:hypothetical protein